MLASHGSDRAIEEPCRGLASCEGDFPAVRLYGTLYGPVQYLHGPPGPGARRPRAGHTVTRSGAG
jgi:hypothetical protein